MLNLLDHPAIFVFCQLLRFYAASRNRIVWLFLVREARARASTHLFVNVLDSPAQGGGAIFAVVNESPPPRIGGSFIDAPVYHSRVLFDDFVNGGLNARGLFLQINDGYVKNVAEAHSIDGRRGFFQAWCGNFLC